MEVTNFNFVSQQTNEIIIENNQHQTNNFLIIPDEDIDFNLSVILKRCETKHIQIGIYNYHKHKIKCHINVQFLDQYNECDVNVIALGADQSNTQIEVKATVVSENNKIIQNIKGFLFSSQAFISGLPLLNIETNQIIASHGLAIGSLNKEQIFYLMSKGFDKNQVKKILLLSQFENLLSYCNDNEKQRYLEKINNLWSNKHD